MPQSVRTALTELKQALLQLYGERLRGLYLYGSYARGDFSEEDSDVDLLIAIEGEVKPTREIDHVSKVASDICLKYDLLIAVFPVQVDWLAERKSPFFKNIRREAILL
jgi:predicted nucleotidyltransferase